jgi:hypothetical protein
MILEAAQSLPIATIISLDTHRQSRRPQSSDALRLLALFAVCLFGCIGSFADSAVARTTLLLIESPGELDGNGLVSTMLWAMIVNVAVCAAVMLLGYMALSRPPAKVVQLRQTRRDLRR